THIAVFVPLLFLSGVSSVLFTQLAIVVMFSLFMSLFVAVTIVPVLCSRLLHLHVAGGSKSIFGRISDATERALTALDDAYRKVLEVALHHRPTVLASSAALTILAFLILPTIPSEMLPETDEGEVSVSARLPAGTRIERAEAVALQMEEVVRTNVPEAVTVISNAGGGGFMGGSASSVRLEIQ